jgi:hypothetical protein
MLRSLFRQRQLLSDGRVTMAHITKIEKKRGEEGTIWRVHYEWTLLNGVRRTGHTDRSRAVPIGGYIPVLYERDNPKRHRLYPMSMVRLRRC